MRAGASHRLFLLVLYTCSGASSLAFEVLWARMLALQFGVSIFGVVVTIAAFMGGLGLGSLIALRALHASRRPLLVFAWLEGAIACYALVLPWLLGYAEQVLIAIAPGVSLSMWHSLQAGALLFLILIPAIAMGAGFPLILRALGTEKHALGRLYGLNACGAAIGALLPLWLLPAFGWITAVETVAALGLAVAIAAAVLALRQGDVRVDDAEERRAALRPSLSILLAYGAIGAASIMLEVGWTRLYGMVLLRTEYVMAVILAVYLLGIGLGSLLAHHMKSGRWLSLFPLLVGTAGLSSLWVLPWISTWVQQREFASLAGALWAEGTMLALVTLPATLALGAWLPLLAARYGRESVQGPLLYGVNSMGAAGGALLAGFVFIPGIGTPLTIILASLVLFAAGMRWAGSTRMWWALPFLLALAWPVSEFPPAGVLLPASQGVSRDLYRHEDAMAITHVVELNDGQRLLLSDLQRMDASTEQAAVELQMNQARLALLLHPRPESVLFLGLGTGISAAGSLAYTDLERTAVELSAGSIEAARTWFAPVNGDISGRAIIVQDDARRFLRTSAQAYDVIIGDVFHPDQVGRSALLSVQQFERARARLAPQGLFVQWLALNQFDLEALQLILRSFVRVFPDARMFMDGFRVALVGGMGALEPSSRLRDILQRPAADLESQSGGEGIWTWLGRYWGELPVDDGGAVQDEWRPRIEFHLPQARYRNGLEFDRVLAWLLERRPAPEEAAAALGVAAAERENMERAYIAADLALRAWLASLQGDTSRSNRLIRFAFEANPRDRWVGFSLADNMLAALEQIDDAGSGRGLDRVQALEAVLSVRPDHVDTLRALWLLAREAGDEARMRDYLSRLSDLSPFDKDVIEFNVLTKEREALPRREN